MHNHRLEEGDLDEMLTLRVEGALLGSGKWANPRVAYNLLDGTGTYFASVTHSFLVRTFRPACAACLASTFVDHELQLQKMFEASKAITNEIVPMPVLPLALMVKRVW